MNKLIAIIGVLLIVWLIAGYEKPEQEEDLTITSWIDDEVNWMIEPTPTYIWLPQPDITAYELAILLPYLFGGTEIESIEGDLKRHFTEEK